MTEVVLYRNEARARKHNVMLYRAKRSEMFLLYSRRTMGGGGARAVPALNGFRETGFRIETRLNKSWRGSEIGFAYIFSPVTWSITVRNREDRCISRRSCWFHEFSVRFTLFHAMRFYPIWNCFRQQVFFSFNLPTENKFTIQSYGYTVSG